MADCKIFETTKGKAALSLSLSLSHILSCDVNVEFVFVKYVLSCMKIVDIIIE
jgi:hypothetical protein